MHGTTCLMFHKEWNISTLFYKPMHTLLFDNYVPFARLSSKYISANLLLKVDYFRFILLHRPIIKWTIRSLMCIHNDSLAGDSLSKCSNDDGWSNDLNESRWGQNSHYYDLLVFINVSHRKCDKKQPIYVNIIVQIDHIFIKLWTTPHILKSLKVIIHILGRNVKPTFNWLEWSLSAPKVHTECTN